MYKQYYAAPAETRILTITRPAREELLQNKFFVVRTIKRKTCRSRSRPAAPRVIRRSEYTAKPRRSHVVGARRSEHYSSHTVTVLLDSVAALAARKLFENFTIRVHVASTRRIKTY